MSSQHRVHHKTYGPGTIVTFYEFYNNTFVDVQFDNYPELMYLQYESLSIEEVI